MKYTLQNKNGKKIFIVLAVSLLLPLSFQFHSYATYYSCDARCLSWLCQNIPNNSWFQVVGNSWGEVYDGISSSWYCRYCYAKVYNYSGSTHSFCTTVVRVNGGQCNNCNMTTSPVGVRVENYVLDAPKDNCVQGWVGNIPFFTCTGNTETGDCYATDDDSLGSCP